MSTITYLDGTQLTSTALTDKQCQTAFQIATAQMLGIVIFTSPMTLTADSNIATPVSMGNLAVGQTLTGTGITPGTTIQAVGSTTITMTSPATASGLQSLVVAPIEAYSQVRVDWQQQGQPSWGINDDIVAIGCTTADSDYSRMRDIVGTAGDEFITQTDVFTRRWRTRWTFYGPNSLDNARAVRSALIKIPFVADLLATNNLYGDPSIAEPGRNPELFQGEWWQRADLIAEFNEEITETYTAGIVASVEVLLNTKDGQVADFTVDV